MKKSFKKAGAAVLSMAMLLSMGAMSMPVYADNPNGVTPGAVKVTIPGIYKQGEGDSADVDQNTPNKLKYEYLDISNVNEADVTMYRVATLGTDGWKWDPLFTGVNNSKPSTDEGFSSWADLLEQKGGNGADADFFKYSSTELQKLASYLERTVRDTVTKSTADLGSNPTQDQTDEKAAAATALNRITVGTSKITSANAATGVNLPKDAELANNANKIGYYLIVTNTDQAGVIIQPVLISLKNGANNPKDISLKGTTIKLTKTIMDAADTDTPTYKEADAVSSTGNTAVVAKNDTVKYQIAAQLPKYDSGVEASKIKDFVIEDIADPGIVIDTDSIVVVVSTDDERGKGATVTAGDNVTLKKSDASTGYNKDYILEETGTGFKITIKGAQMMGQTADGAIATTKWDDDNDANTAEVQRYKTMQNLYITVTFNAIVDSDSKYTQAELDAWVAQYKTDYAAANNGTNTMETDAQIAAKAPFKVGDYKFKRTYTDYVTVDKITADDYNAISDKDVIDAINKNVYDKDTVAKSGAFINANLTGAGIALVDVTEQKKDAEGNLIYAKGDGTETTSENDGAGTVYTPVMVVSESHLFERVKALLARDKVNSQNGNENKATMEFGNEYATGGGESTDEDTTRLYSVDIDLNKMVEKVELTAAPQLGVSDVTTAVSASDLAQFAQIVIDNIDITEDDVDSMTAEQEEAADAAIEADTGSVTYKGANRLAVKSKWSKTDEEWPNNTANPVTDITGDDNIKKANYAIYLWKLKNDAIATEAGKVTTDVDADTEYYTDDNRATVEDKLSLTTDAEANQALYLLKQENQRRKEAKGYDADETTDPVVGAVFRLSKVYGENTKEIGLAASDASGDLRVLESATAEDYNTYQSRGDGADGTNGYVVFKITENSTDKYYKYKKGTGAGSADYAWKMLTIGDYEIEEIYVPAGYKAIQGKAKFTVGCDKDGTEYTGKFTGSSTSDLFRTETERNADEGDKETIEFYFNKGEGELESTMYNKYQDTLPATGGIGTVLFTAGGISVVLIAGALFVMYMKKKNSEDEE